MTRQERRVARAARVCLEAWMDVVGIERGIKDDDDLTVEAALWQLMGDDHLAGIFREARGKDGQDDPDEPPPASLAPDPQMMSPLGW